jgi:hypothetical protein
MALTGNCSHTEYIEHATNTVTQTITNPNGVTENVEVPEIVATTTNYTNIYLCIKQIDHRNHWDTDSDGNQIKIAVMHYRYAGYTDQATRNADQENFLFSDVGDLKDYDHTQNLYAQIYNEIKILDEKTNLIDS